MTDADVIFEWRHHPLTSNPRLAVGLALVILAIAGVIGSSFHSAYWACFAAVVLLLSLHRFWLPTVYRVGEQELERRQWWFVTRRPWTEFKRAVLLKDAVFLSPFTEPSPLDGHRGWWIPTPPEDRKFADWVVKRLPISPR